MASGSVNAEIGSPRVPLASSSGTTAGMPDLVIGGRRSGVPRPWRAAVIALAMLGVTIVVAWFIYRRSVAYEMPGGSVRGAISWQRTPNATSLLTFGSGSLAWNGSIAVLRATGDAHTLGAVHGRLLAPYLPAVVAAAAPSIQGTVGKGGWFGGWTHEMRLDWRWRFVDDGLIDTDRRMIAGLTRGAAASGVELSYEELVRDQVVLDIGVPSPRSAEADHHSIARSLTVVATQQDAPARVWIGRVVSLPGLDDGGEAAIPVVTLARPEGKIAWAGVGWPGQLGILTGVNASQIAVMVDPARTADIRPTRTARPIAHLARTVLEQAKTLDEAVKIIETTPTLGTAAIVLADGTTGAWVLVERTPSKAIIERHPKSPVVGDVLTTNALSSDPENDRARRMLPTMTRIERATRLVRQPLPDAAALAAVLRDRRGADDSTKPSGHRGVIDDGQAVHTVILDPASLELWVADPRANGRMRAFDLRHELRAEGDRPAPPADIAADPEAEPDRVSILARARAELRDARGALRAGDRDAAAEACARARTRAPQLPEALLLDGLIAQARGDLARARELYQQWIDAGADDPKGEERARALLAR